MSDRNNIRRKNNELRRTIGAGSTVAAFLAFGMSPLISAPVVRADDILIDLPDFSTLSDVSGLVDASFLSTDVPGSAAESGFSWANVFDATYDNLHAGAQEFLVDPANAGLLELLNGFGLYEALFGRLLIGNGIDDFAGANTSLFGWLPGIGDLGDGVSCSVTVVPALTPATSTVF